MDRFSLVVLGNGGMVNHLLPHNGLVISKNFLVDCPPDVVKSFQTVGLSTLDIDIIFISHFHADHTFGFPFFLLDRWIAGGFGRNDNRQLQIYGPKGTTEYILRLTEMGLQPGHPALEWFFENVKIREVGQQERASIGDFKLEFFRLAHIESSLGFSLYRASGTLIFSYLTDTVWGEEVEQELRKYPMFAWIDMNGGPSGLHASFEDCLRRGVPITEGRTIYLGTHTSGFLESKNAQIRMVRQGDIIERKV